MLRINNYIPGHHSGAKIYSWHLICVMLCTWSENFLLISDSKGLNFEMKCNLRNRPRFLVQCDNTRNSPRLLYKFYTRSWFLPFHFNPVLLSVMIRFLCCFLLNLSKLCRCKMSYCGLIFSWRWWWEDLSLSEEIHFISFIHQITHTRI